MAHAPAETRLCRWPGFRRCRRCPGERRSAAGGRRPGARTPRPARALLEAGASERRSPAG